MGEDDAIKLLVEGHSIEDLIELFSDEQEQHDLYVNSALVYKDFDNIIEILKKHLSLEIK